MKVSLPYGPKTLSISIPDGNLLEILSPRGIPVPDDPAALIGQALSNPLGTAGLAELAAGIDRAALVVDKEGRLSGIVTDGDLRRILTKRKTIHKLKVEEIMSRAPKTVEEDQTAAEALGIMELYGITHLVILDREKKVRGMIHLHDLLGREEFKLNGGSAFSTRTHRRPDNAT